MSLKLLKESLILILETHYPQSLTEAYRLLGGKGKLSGSTAKRMRTLVPGLDEWVARNKANAGKAKGEGEPKEGKAKFRISKTSKGDKRGVVKSKYPHSASNPFREGSNYSLAFDILASFPEGLPLAEWRESYAKAARKSLKLASYDIQVLLTAKDSPTGERHRSCRDGFYIERETDHVTLKI